MEQPNSTRAGQSAGVQQMLQKAAESWRRTFEREEAASLRAAQRATRKSKRALASRAEQPLHDD